MPPRHLDPMILEKPAPLGPWTPDHLIRVLVSNALGVALVFGGWWLVGGVGSARTQLGWLNVSLLGLAIAGAANGLWLARGYRAVNLGRRAILPYGSLVHPPSSEHEPAEPDGATPLVAASVMSRYHRRGCLLVAEKDVRVAGRGEHERARRQPCEVCRP